MVVVAKFGDPMDTTVDFCSAGLHRKLVSEWSKGWCGNRSLDRPRRRSSGSSCIKARCVTQQRGRATAFLDFVFGGWGESFPDHAIDDYIRDARAAGIYLMPGDEVDIHVASLGVIRNEVVE